METGLLSVHGVGGRLSHCSRLPVWAEAPGLTDARVRIVFALSHQSPGLSVPVRRDWVWVSAIPTRHTIPVAATNHPAEVARHAVKLGEYRPMSQGSGVVGPLAPRSHLSAPIWCRLVVPEGSALSVAPPRGPNVPGTCRIQTPRTSG